MESKEEEFVLGKGVPKGRSTISDRQVKAALAKPEPDQFFGTVYKPVKAQIEVMPKNKIHRHRGPIPDVAPNKESKVLTEYPTNEEPVEIPTD